LSKGHKSSGRGEDRRLSSSEKQIAEEFDKNALVGWAKMICASSMRHVSKQRRRADHNTNGQGEKRGVSDVCVFKCGMKTADKKQK